ncbi:MAG: acyltransferase [Planctomycetota bacterium]|jgi:hypothetical protein
MVALNARRPSTAPRSDVIRQGGRDVAIDYLRTSAIVLVVLIHAAAAYLSIGTLSEVRFLDSLVPVVDASRSDLLNLLGVCDFFLMPSLFLVSGLVSASSLERRGSGGFFVARLRRLGIPFVAGSLLLAPLTHWPSYLLVDPRPQTAYLTMFLTSGWPADPLWFIWVLLAFDGIVALARWLAPAALAGLRRQPTALVILIVTIVSFVPLSLIVPCYRWASLGPFNVEAARIGLYFAYFLLGMAIGTGDEWRKPGWPRHWGRWLLLGLASCWVYLALLWPQDGIGPPEFPPRVETWPLVSRIAFGSAFAVTCAGLSLGFLGVFRRFAGRRRPVLDSLSANAFGIYFFHYVFTIWIQFALLSVPWPALAKFGVAFAGALTLSWGMSMLVRRIPAVRRVL